eukprot:XP_017950458.1 PREDICTED: uncharacterized protein LOC105947533 isoform X2 [Xenopus tropicalis]
MLQRGGREQRLHTPWRPRACPPPPRFVFRRCTGQRAEEQTQHSICGGPRRKPQAGTARSPTTPTAQWDRFRFLAPEAEQEGERCPDIVWRVVSQVPFNARYGSWDTPSYTGLKGGHQFVRPMVNWVSRCLR